MRLAIVTSWPTDIVAGSGTAVFFNALVNGLQRRQYDVDIIAPVFDPTDYVEITLKRFLFNTELRTDPRIQQAEVVIGLDYDGYGLDTANCPPLIATSHAIYGDVIQWETDPVRTMVVCQAFFDQVAMRKAAAVTAASNYGRDRLIDLYGIAPDKINVIPLGMPAPAWIAQLDSQPPTVNDHPIILAVCKMYPRKRLDILIRAIAQLRESYPRIELRVMGDGLEWDRLHMLADELAIQENISWLGYITDPAQSAREWGRADIFVHPSSQETFGFVYLEAMLAAKPIIAVQAGAAPEVLHDAAILVPPENPVALAAAIDRLLASESLRQDYGQRARRRAPMYTHQRMIDSYVTLIEEIATKRGLR